MNDRNRLKEQIDALSPMGIRFVARLVDSLSSPPSAEVTRTWLTEKPEWVEYFGLTISAHHGATTDALGSVGFEIAFRNACEAVGWRTDPMKSATRRFVDIGIRVGGKMQRKLSLKSTAAKKLSATTAHISKLTEAAWIQDVRSAKTRRERTLELFREYRAAVDSIMMLRAFRKTSDVIPERYQLIEIPSEMFISLEDAPLSAFASDGPSIDCFYGEHPVAARVSLDRSDAKITIKQIQLSACTIHAEWYLAET